MLLSTTTDPAFYAALVAADGQPEIYEVTLCDLFSLQRLIVRRVFAVGLEPFVMDVRGVEGNLSQLLTLAQVNSDSILAIGGKRVVTFEVTSKPLLPPNGFCP